MSPIISLSPDVLSALLPFLSAEDFVRFMLLTCKSLRSHSKLIEREVKFHLIKKWNISMTTFEDFDVLNIEEYLKLLPHALSISNEVKPVNQIFELNGLTTTFRGQVGSVNRSITASSSFPTASNLFCMFASEMEKCIASRKFKKILCLMKEIFEAKKLEFRHVPQFSIPFKCKSIEDIGLSDDEIHMIHLTNPALMPYKTISYIAPRSIAYYEISIKSLHKSFPSSSSSSSLNMLSRSSSRMQLNRYFLERTQHTTTQTNTTNTLTPPPTIIETTITTTMQNPPWTTNFMTTNNTNNVTPTMNNNINNNGMECVAVGLATAAFDTEEKFPGWDYESYGYHGDDGGIFHGNGRKFDIYGPIFGPNDIVGCGLDYTTRTIFYTLNGVHLGEAFYDVDTTRAYYPTVGIDAQVTVTFNFGATPFEFDLAQYIHLINQQKLVSSPSSSLSSSLSSSTKSTPRLSVQTQTLTSMMTSRNIGYRATNATTATMYPNRR